MNKITKATASRMQLNEKSDGVRKRIDEIKENQKKSNYTILSFWIYINSIYICTYTLTVLDAKRRR